MRTDSRSSNSRSSNRVQVWVARLFLGVMAAALGLALGSNEPARAFPFPSPVYDILSTSGNHQASLLNLPLGQPGVPQAPMPVDVDGDLLPDVTVAVNLVDLGGVSNPPDLAALLVPNIEINRLLTGSLLGQPLPPLRIEVQLRLMDLGGSEPDTTIRFGYETGPGGSIPPVFKARLEGIENFFNPLAATVDTGPSAGRPVTYDGPLRLVGGIDSGDSEIDLGLGFAPLPSSLRVTYGSDDTGSHLTYAHTAPREVDARADIDVVDADGELHLDARVDRLPANIAVDIAEGGSDAGAVEWHSSSDGRRPDVDVHLESVGSGAEDEPLYADIDLESLPPEMGAAWSLPEGGPTSVSFDTGGPAGHGVGGVDVDIRNHAPDAPGALDAFVPEQQQFLSIQQDAGPGGESLQRISGRVERVRSLSYSDVGGVLSADVSMGDGEQPLQVVYDCKVECSENGSTRLIDVDTTVAPLPADFSVAITDAGDDPRVAPMLIDYTASQPADVTGSIGLAQEGSTGSTISCGAARTVCADLELRDLPTELHARLGQYTAPHDEDEVADEADLRLAVDLVEGAIAPDLAATVVLGPENPGEDPLVAEATALALPEHTRVYLHQHKETTDEGEEELALDRAAFHACDRAVDSATCASGSEGEIGAVTLSLRSFLQRPVGFPVPLHDRDQYATVTANPDGLEVGARVEHVRNLEYLNTGTLQGVFASAGDNETPFTARIDIQDSPTDDIELDEERTLTGVTRDLQAEAVVADLPYSFGVCFRTPNEALVPSSAVVAGGAAFTEDCEESDLDGDPLAFAYNLDFGGLVSAPVKVDGTFATTVTGDLDGEEYSETLEGEASVPEVPTSVIVQASIPEADTVGPIEAIYDANGELDIDFAARMFVNDSRCLDPRPEAESMCVEAYLHEIPEDASIFYDPTVTTENLFIDTSGDGMDLLGLNLSTVRPRPEPIDEPFPTPQALIVDGYVLDLPAHVRGTVVLPEDDGDGNEATQPASTFIVCASEAPCKQDGATGGRIGTINLHARNVVVADPTPLGGTGEVPEPRDTDIGEAADITDEILMFQRGHAFHASLEIHGVGGAGFRQVARADGRKLQTTEVLLRFGQGVSPVIRAYADLDLGTERTIADVMLGGVPASTRFCFRGEDNVSTPVDPTWCDTHGDDDGDGKFESGAVQLRTTPGADTSGLDVDAYIRQTAGGDATGMSGRVRITDLPNVLQGTIPSEGRGSLDIAGRASENGAPRGIGVLRFEAASFDIEDHGFAEVPWFRTIGPLNTVDFPAPALGSLADPNHMSVVVTDDGFHARGQLNGLQHIALRDGLCDAPASVASGNPTLYPGYPVPTDGTQPYTCARIAVDESIPGTAAGDPFAVRAVARDGDEVVRLQNAGLTAFPRSLQFTLAEGEVLKGDGSFKDACRPEPFVDEGCLAPMVRVDIDGDPSELFGSLEIGTEDHLAELAGVDPRNPDPGVLAGLTWADLDGIPAEGARVRIGTWSSSPLFPQVEEGVAAIAHVRLPLPSSLQIDAPQTWERADPTVIPTWKATDIRMHYVARNADGSVIPSLGDLKVLVHTAPAGGQILLTGGEGLVEGTPIPGEMAMAVYLREAPADKRTFVQADGYLSTDMSVTALIFPDQPPELPGGFRLPSSSPDRIALDVLHIPGRADASDTWDGWHDPSFRLQAEILDDSPPPEPCSVTSCAESSSRLAEVSAVLDFHPEGSSTATARLIQAVVHTLEDGPMGVQVAGFQNVHDRGTAGQGWQDGDAEISLFGNLKIDPLHAYSFDGVPWLANWSITVDSSIEIGLSAERVKSLQLFNKTLGIVSQFDTVDDADPGQAAMGPIAMRPDYIYAGAEFLGVTVFGFELPPWNEGEVLPLEFPSCDGGDIAWEIIGGDVLGGSAAQFAAEHLLQTLPFADPHAGEAGDHDYGYGVMLERNTRNDILVFPEINLPFETGPGLQALGAGVLAEFLPGVAHGIGCQIFNLDEKDLLTEAHPGVALPAVVNTHLVPGAEDGTDTDPLSAELPPDADDDVVLGDETMCGRHHHDTIVVEGTVQVAGSPGPLCEAEDVGWLALSANEITVESTGTIEADNVVTSDCSATEPLFSNYDFERDHATNPLIAYLTENIGSQDPFTVCQDYDARGTGAGHGGFGGSAAPLFPLGTGYDKSDVAGYATAGYAGGNGSTATGGGEGGGFVQVVAAEITINGDITANGENASSADSDCATASVGGGGGSGGGIAILGNRIQFGSGSTLQARGGNGGNGAFFGGGGGAMGDIEVVGGIITPAPPIDVAAGGGGSANGSCGIHQDGLPGQFLNDAYFGHVDEGQSSYVLPMGQGPSGDIWYTTNDVDFDRDGVIEESDPSHDEENPRYSETTIRVPVVATSADPNLGSEHSGTNDNGMTVALCGVALSPDLNEADRIFQALTPDFVSPSDPCGLTDLNGIARVDIARVIDWEYLPDKFHIDAFQGFTLDIEDLSANPDWCPAFLSQAIQDEVCGVEPISAYYGLYTVVLRSPIPGNDCLDPFDSGSIFDDLACWDSDPLPSNDPDNDCDDPTDFPAGAGFAATFPGFANIGPAYDDANCFYPNVEVPPGDAGPDVVIGIDNDAPVITAVNPDLYDSAGQNDIDRGIVWTNRLDARGSLSAEDPLGDTEIIDTSGVRFFECFETTGSLRADLNCTGEGTYDSSISAGDGRKELEFTVYDAVGNSSTLTYDDLVLDTTIPASVLTADPDPGPLPNGWYDDAPTLTLSGFGDPAPDSLESGAHPDGRYRFQMDNGSDLACEPDAGETSCVIPVPIGPGLHRVWYTAVDRAGNRGERADDPDDDVCTAPAIGRNMGCREFGRDFEAPLLGAFGAPDAADGANGWWVTRPWVGIASFDLPVGGSGIDPDVFPSEFEYQRQQVGGPVASFQDYEGPFQLGQGTWIVRGRARDIAGNPNSTPPQNPPTNELPVMTERQFQIDSIPPSLVFLTSGTAGANGWFTTGVSVTASGSDNGSGIVAGVAPSGVFVSIDGGPFELSTGPVFIGEGEHVVRAYAVDVAGNRSAVREKVVNVDLSHPVSALRTTPADPARGQWFRSQPTVVLRATDGDDNAGVSSVVYCLGAGCTPSTPYTGPFTAPAGVTTVRWRALDASGTANHEAIREQVLRSDITPPAPVATQASKLIWSRLLGPSTIQLKFTVRDTLAGPLQPVVIVYDALGNPVRRIEGAPINVAANTTVNGSVNWDGKGDGLALVPIGVYHYRVVLTDQAGNIAQSGESKPITIKLL